MNEELQASLPSVSIYSQMGFIEELSLELCDFNYRTKMYIPQLKKPQSLTFWVKVCNVPSV